MSRARALILALVGLALPVGLALGVYVASAGSLAAVPSVVQPPLTYRPGCDKADDVDDVRSHHDRGGR